MIASHTQAPMKSVEFPDTEICAPPVVIFQSTLKGLINIERLQSTAWVTKLTSCMKYTNRVQCKVQKILFTFVTLHSLFFAATIKVYHDFFTYSGGIYRHTDLSLSQRTGYHSVRIVGWGEEVTYRGVEKYWVSKCFQKKMPYCF